MKVIRNEELPTSGGSPEFVGEDNGGVGISVILVEAEPGRGPSLHKHDYPEVFVVPGDGTLRQVAIHVSPRFATEWLE